jgi:hypothetical protein
MKNLSAFASTGGLNIVVDEKKFLMGQMSLTTLYKS